MHVNRVAPFFRRASARSGIRPRARRGKPVDIDCGMVISITPRGADGTTFYQVVRCDPEAGSDVRRGFGLIKLGPAAGSEDPPIITVKACGTACTCPDFSGGEAAGGCKHVRALHLLGIL